MTEPYLPQEWPVNPRTDIDEPYQPSWAPNAVLTTDRELHVGREPTHIDRENRENVRGHNAPRGVSGNGQRELAQVITGLRPVTSGSIAVSGSIVTNKSPSVINALGLSHIPEERMVDGVIKEFTVAENLVLQTHGSPEFTRGGIFMNFRRIGQACQEAITAYEIKTPGTDTPVKNLSGGNIQKLVLARELARQPKVLIAAQPSRGVDIGATEYIHRRLLEERARGTAILLISEDLDEILALSDRIMVMYEGQIVSEVLREAVNIQQLGAMMAGAAVEKTR